MDAFDALRAAGALILVLGLILGLTWLLRRYGKSLGVRAGVTPSDLRVVEWKTLDVRRKLAVIRWDGRDHLLCLGPAGDCVVAERRTPDLAAAPPAANDGARP
ncbi:MAG: flagellar biosynthetic protein FliO [Alphaproteobacteria bacterium]|nr:flagellar biosynthetic protein FliO [Alphaproteobacteria bacterium]